ncbi:MAG: hypothetical protein Q3979_05610 [Actinomycetaceae bacterium]|nr:hypothetical protein [Actinomycetaceae bacterium]
MFTGDLSFRRCALLADQLPLASRYRTALGGDGSLSAEAHILRIIEADIRALTTRSAKPFPLPREGWLDEARAKADLEERRARNWLARHPEARR